jgi:transposase InsO family protein
MIHQLLKQLQAEKAYPLSQCCRVLGISRSGYYEAERRTKRTKSLCETSIQLKSVFETSGRCYGSRRVKAALEGKGIRIGRYKVRTLMRKNQLKPIWKRKFIHTTDSKHNLPVFENILNRQFKPEAANQAWVADITYIRTLSGWLYLAAVLDLYSRKIVGWAMAPSMPAELVCVALQMAIAQRQPTAGLIVHSDRGSQYASDEYQKLIEQHGFIGSMSRKGNCWDNSVMERFFLNLKMERVWRQHYANHQEAIKDITDYIVCFYNAKRLHSVLGNVPPNLYEQEMAQK